MNDEQAVPLVSEEEPMQEQGVEIPLEGQFTEDQFVDEKEPEPPQDGPPSNGNTGYEKVTPAPTVQPTHVNQIPVKVTHEAQIYRPASEFQTPAPTRPAPVHKRPVTTARFAVKADFARAMLDEVIFMPESMDWRLGLHRVPTGLENPEVKIGPLGQRPIMPYHALITLLGHQFGGGMYRVFVCHSSNGAPVIEYPTKIKAMIIDVSTEGNPAKNYDANKEDAPPPVAATETEESDTEKDIRDALAQVRKIEAQNRVKAAEAKVRQSEYNSMLVERQMMELQRELLGGNKNEAPKTDPVLEARIGNMEKMFEKLSDAITKLAEVQRTPVAPPPPDNTKELLVAMQSSTNSMLATLIPAMTVKPPQTDTGLELAKLSNESNKTMMATMMTAMTATQARDSKQSVLESRMFQTMIEQISSKRNDQMGPDMFMKLIGEGRRQVEQTMRAAGVLKDEEGEDEGYNPKAGLLGNFGKLIFEGIRTAVKTVGSNPQIAETLVSLFGKTNPTPDEQLQAARALEMRNQQQAIAMTRQRQLGVPPGMPPPMQPGQPGQMRPQVRAVVQPRPLVTPPPAAGMRPVPQQPRPAQGVPPQARSVPPTASGVSGPPKSVAPPPAAMVPVSPPVAQPPVAATPQPVEAVNPPSVQPAAAIPSPETEVNVELEAEATGVDVAGFYDQQQPQDTSVPPTEENAAGPMDIPPAIEPVAQTPVPRPVPPPPPEPPAVPPEAVESDARLREYVTSAMEVAYEDLTDARPSHRWPEQAADLWNGNFLAALVATPDNAQRMVLISDKCDVGVWNKVVGLVENNGPLYSKLMDAITALVEMAKEA